MLNTILITGNLTTAPERVKNDNINLVIFRLANNGYKKNDENTLFIQVNCWDKLGERALENLHKGSLVTVRGRLAVRYYLNKDQIRCTSYEIVADAIDYLDKKRNPDDIPPKPTDVDSPVDEVDYNDIPF